MEPKGRTSAVWDWLWLLAWGLGSSVWCVTAAGAIGPTFDEPIYVARGLEGWRHGGHAGLMHLGTMPLPIDVETLPLYLWERWRGVAFDTERDLDQLLPWARAGALLFWWILLFYGRLVGRLLSGPWAGRLAVALLACEPSMVAHAALATTDIALTGCLLALAYHFCLGRNCGWFHRLLIPALCFGAAVLAKASGLVYGLVCLVMIEVDCLARAGAFTPAAGGSAWARLRQASAALRPLRSDLGWIIGGGMALVFIYCGCDWRTQPSYVTWAHGLGDGVFKHTMVWLAENLAIFSNAGEGLVRQIKHNMHGHGVYLLGYSDPRSLWYYFPVILAIKLSVPILLAPVLVAILWPRALLNWACVTAAVLVLCSLKFQVQIGVRLVLPLVALGITGLSAALVNAWCESTARWRRAILVSGATAAICWTSAATLVVWPHALCYTNELWGSRDTAYQRVSDGNYDWGQGVPELACWQREHGIDSLDVWYFGTDPAVKREPFRVRTFEYMKLHGPAEVSAALRGHYVAASTTLLYGSAFEYPECRAIITYLRVCRPMAKTQTFFIYDFTEKSVPREHAACPQAATTGAQGKLNVAATAGLVTSP
jgi:hypothetical protein